MRIGVPKEIKNHEYRVGLTPSSVRELAAHGHELLVERGARAITVHSNRDNIEEHVLAADLVIGGVLVPGAAAPRLVTRDVVARMKPGSVVVDVAIDQGGCFETSRPTTHAEPTFRVGDVVHYCVANMPGPLLAA